MIATPVNNIIESSNMTIHPIEQSRLGEVDINNAPFGKVFSDHMYMVDYEDGKWKNAQILPYGKITVSPSMSALHYGQSIFEGLKAYKNSAGDPLLFRPWENYKRMNASAHRMCMPEIPKEIFAEGLRELISLDRDWIPTKEGTALYIRPFYFATDEYVGIRPSDNYKFMIFTCPVGAYYPDPVSLQVTAKYVRASEGGTGEAKAAGNYASSLLASNEAKHAGYTNVLWLDGKNHRFVEECGTMNVFFVIDGVVITPKLTGSILRGTTRKAVIKLLRDQGYRVQIRLLPVDEIWEAYEDGKLEEAFGTGTAATIAHVSRIAHDGTVDRIKDHPEMVLPPVSERKVGPAILKLLDDIRNGNAEDKFDWVVKAQDLTPERLTRISTSTVKER
jgi:branched-chain amino acid aminotransferase